MSESNNELYGRLIELRNVELHTLWTRFNFHLIVNTGFLIAFLTAEDTALLRHLKLVPHLFGITLAILWLLSELAGRSALNHRDGKIAEFENRFWATTPLRDFNVFREIPRQLYHQSKVSLAFIVLFMLAWLFLFCRDWA